MTQEITLTCYSLPAAPGLDNIKFEKGREHDRQALGFILPANTQLQIRQPNNDAGNARLRLLCNDSAYEKSLTLNGNWQTISTTVDSVPFIDTLFFAQDGEFSVIYRQPAAKICHTGVRDYPKTLFSRAGKNRHRLLPCWNWTACVFCCPGRIALMSSMPVSPRWMRTIRECSTLIMTGPASAIALHRRLIKMSPTAILLKRINTVSARLIISPGGARKRLQR